MERLEEKIDSLKELFLQHQNRNDEQFAALEKYLMLKIDTVDCNDCSMVNKIKNVEDEITIIEDKINELYTWKNITMGALFIIGIILPYILPKLGF